MINSLFISECVNKCVESHSKILGDIEKIINFVLLTEV